MDKLKFLEEKKYLFYRYYVKRALLEYFFKENFIEIDAPCLILANAPDPFIDPLIVKSIANNKTFQLHTSPEFYLKKKLALGFDKVFSLGKVFRDDPLSKAHGLEFSMLEWYRKKADLNALIKDCNKLLLLTKEAFEKAFEINIDAIPKIKILSLIDLFKDQIGVELNKNSLVDDLKKRGENLRPWATFQDAFFHCMVKYIEPSLPSNEPIALFDWPIELAALSAPLPHNPDFCSRFEIYYKGLEIANAYQECNDPKEIRLRFIKENEERALLLKTVFPLDEEFFKALEHLPKMAGIALGFDRLLMAVGDIKDINLLR